jgi:hypothetical protein|tara:strand:+ start:89 stop:247 length:159 start_codon:yes stop_codon:yes gene_type:complete
VYSDVQYIQWLRTLSPELLRKERENLEIMVKTPMTAVSKEIVKLKINRIENL